MSKSSGSNNNELRVLFADGIIPDARRRGVALMGFVVRLWQAAIPPQSGVKGGGGGREMARRLGMGTPLEDPTCDHRGPVLPSRSHIVLRRARAL